MVADVQGQASLTLVEEKSLMWISTEFCVHSAQSQASIPLVQQGSVCQTIPLERSQLRIIHPVTGEWLWLS